MSTPTATPPCAAGALSPFKPNTAANASSTPAWLTAARQTWGRLAPRERQGVALATALVGLALLWTVALGPAWAVLKRAPAEHARLDATLQHMQTLAEQARNLKAQPRLSRDEALRALEAATTRLLGTASRLTVVADRATVLVQNADAKALADWLEEVRVNARVAPSEGRLTLNADAASSANAPRWSGTLVLPLQP